MKMKKLWSLLLALAMVLSLSVTAFAEVTSSATELGTGSTAGNSATVVIGSVVNVPTLKVTISPPGTVVINPYKLAYESPAITAGTDTLVAAPVAIKSNTTMQVKVDAAPTAQIDTASKVKIVGKDSLASATDPSLYLELNMANVVGTGSDASDLISYYAGSDVEGKFKGTSNAVINSTTTANTASITLAAAESEAEDKATYGVFKICGESGGTTWTNSDLVTINIVFNITPMVAQAGG